MYNAAKKVRGGNAIVEIGSWKGRSTVCLASGSKDGNKADIYAVDHHTGSSEHRRMFGKVDTFEDFRRNVREAGLSAFVKTIRDTSEKTALSFEKPVGLLFIDGSHEYKFVKLDFRLWFIKVVNGGSVVFHDSWHMLGPHLMTAIILIFSGRVKNPGVIDTITYFEKTERNSLAERFKNISFLFYRIFYGLSQTIRIMREMRRYEKS